MRTRCRGADLPSSIPSVPQFEGEDKIDATKEGVDFVAKLNHAVAGEKWEAFGDLFADDCWWRDAITLTFDKRTLRGREAITKAWKTLSPTRKPSGFSADAPDIAFMGISPKFNRLMPTLATLDVPFTFTTEAAPRTKCIGLAKLIPVDGAWRVWVLATEAYSLIDHPFGKLPRELSPSTLIGASQRGRPTPQGLPQLPDDSVLDVIVIGGSCNGLASSIMLDAIGVNAVTFEMEDAAGENWSKRYDQLTLHHGVFMIQLPFYPVPQGRGFPEYLTGKELTRYMSGAVVDLKLPFFAGIKVLSNTWDKTAKTWSTRVRDLRSGDEMVLRAKEIIVATGLILSEPQMPNLTGRDKFAGPVQHTTEHPSSDPYKGRDVLIVGSGNSAHDVARNLSLAGAKSVTMLQRGSLAISQFEPYYAMAAQYHRGQMPVDTADFLNAVLPAGILRVFIMGFTHKLAADQADWLASLESKGYEIQRGVDLLSRLYEQRGRSTYLDQLNVTDLVLADKIKIQRGEARGFVEDGVVVADTKTGEERVIKADGVVLATGYKQNDFPKMCVDTGLLDAESASVIEDIGLLGFDNEGETPGYGTSSGHDHLYFSPLSIIDCRHVSRFVAIQILANVAGEFPERYARDF